MCVVQRNTNVGHGFYDTQGLKLMTLAKKIKSRQLTTKNTLSLLSSQRNQNLFSLKT